MFIINYRKILLTFMHVYTMICHQQDLLFKSILYTFHNVNVYSSSIINHSTRFKKYIFYIVLVTRDLKVAFKCENIITDTYHTIAIRLQCSSFNSKATV